MLSKSINREMPVGEIVVGSILEGLGAIIFELIINGLGVFLRRMFYWTRKKLTGKEREFSEFERLEKRYMGKQVRLAVSLKNGLRKGTFGVVKEVLDYHYVLAEFEDATQQPITIDGKQVFKIKRRHLRLESKTKRAKAL